MTVGDALDDRQSQAGALGGAGAVAANERGEQIFPFALVDARAAVENADHHAGLDGAALQIAADFHAGAAMIQRVLHQIGQQPLDRQPPQRQLRGRLQP